MGTSNLFYLILTLLRLLLVESQIAGVILLAGIHHNEYDSYDDVEDELTNLNGFRLVNCGDPLPSLPQVTNSLYKAEST